MKGAEEDHQIIFNVNSMSEFQISVMTHICLALSDHTLC